MATLDAFPDEIIRHILTFVSPEDALGSVQLLSHRFLAISNESLLWKYYCLHSFTYWHPRHKFQEKLTIRASSVGWKQLWLARKRGNAKVARLLDGVLTTKVGQLKRLKQICQLGYDAKDYLLEQCRCPESAEDFLARRYHANSTLDSIHRGIAVEVWSGYQGAALSSKGLDRAIGAFDMFVLHDQPQDLDYICDSLDTLARQFREQHPTVEEMSTRQKALALVRWLRANNLTGLDPRAPEYSYRSLRNCLMGHALSEEGHSSLPIVSSAIFCCVAERLGMRSACCAFPSHVHASVFAPPGMSLDGREEDMPSGELESMFLDPFGSDDEVTLDDLRSRLVEFGWSLGSEAFLKATPVPLIVARLAQNIKSSYSAVELVERVGQTGVDMRSLRAGYPDLNLEAAVYSSMWAELLMKQTSSFHWDANLDSFLNKFALNWSEDAWIVEKYLLPLYDSFIASQPHQRQRRGWENVRAIVNMLQNLDKRQPTVNRRYTQEIHSRVRFRIGQVFRHKRYHYIGIINGWAANGAAALPTPYYLTTDEADEEAGGADPGTNARENSRRTSNKVYYTCLKANVDRLRVDQENMELMTNPDLIPVSLFYLAGKFFKRFDKETCTFVSNLREFYPDD